MKIIFKRHAISSGPISVLNHLYYYTVHYGLSVKQFTGAHWKYWEKLPVLLKDAQRDKKKLSKIIKDLESYAVESDERIQRRRKQRLQGWSEKETVINAQLNSLFAALPGRILSLTVKELTGEKNLAKEYNIVDLCIEKKGLSKSDYNFIEPDLLLLGDRHLVMVELKTCGGVGSSYKYPPRQLMNYLRLGYECLQSSEKERLPNFFTHIILAPSQDSKWLKNHQSWVIETKNKKDGGMRVKIDVCLKLSRYNRKKYTDGIRKVAKKTPIYYRDWRELSLSLQKAVDKYDDKKNKKHWEQIAKEIDYLSKKASLHVKNSSNKK